MQENKFEDIMYLSGMTAQGCYDQMDEYQKESIQKFGKLIVLNCLMKIHGAKIRSENYDELIARIEQDFGI